jgi:hypothetical protein
MKCTGANLSFLCTLASMMIGPGDSGSSIFRGFLIGFALLPGRPSLNILWGTRIVLFLVCPFMRFPPPRGRGCGGSKEWMGLVTPSDFSTRDCGCVCVCVLSTRFVGRSENRSTRFLNWSCLLLTPLSGMSLVAVMCVWCCGRTLLCAALVYGAPCRVCLCAVCLVYRTLGRVLLCVVCLVYGTLGCAYVLGCDVCLLYQVLGGVLCCVVCILYRWEVLVLSVSCRWNARLDFLLSCIRNLSRRSSQTLLALSGCSAR